jgi:hypothetical protein
MPETVIEIVSTLLPESHNADVVVERYDEWHNQTEAACPAPGCICR